MTVWQDRSQNHAVYKTAENLRSLLESVAQIQELSADAVEPIERLRQILDLAISRLRLTDPILISVSTLDSLNSHFQQEINEVTAFQGNRNVGHLNNANNQADGALVHTASLLVASSLPDLEIVQKTVSTLRESFGQHAKRLETDREAQVAKLSEFNARILEATTEINNQKGRLDTAINQFQQQFSQSEDTRRTEFSTAEKQRASEAAQAEEKRRTQFTTLISDTSITLNSSREAHENEWSERKESLGRETKQLVQHIDDQKNIAEKLVGIITETGWVGGYQRVANEERKAARLWRQIASLSMVGLIIFAGYAFLPTLQGEFNWGSFAGRVFVTLTFGVLAAYAAREAEQHRRVERRNRRVELELASIGPFLMSLPPDNQNEVRRLLAEKFFGQNDIIPVGPNEVSPSSLLDIIKLALGNLTKK